MTTLLDKIDSNSTGLRICEEATLKTLPAAASQVWYPAEPNSYSNFGGQLKLVARRPINASRQNQKGVVVDLDASGGINQDFTQTNHLRLLRGFFFASIREQYDSGSIDNENSVVSNADTSNDTFRMAYADDLGKVIANDLLFATGFAAPANNAVHLVVSSTKVKAGGTLTSSANFADAETVTIGTKVYTFQTVLTNVDGHILIAGTEALSLVALKNAINLTGVAGTDYALATTIHPDVTATSTTIHTVVVAAKKNGRAGNLIATTETSATAAWGAVTLTGGQGDIAVSTNLTTETPPATARVQVVGYQFPVGDLTVDVSNTLPRLVSATIDCTTLALVPGQFIFVGGDLAAQAFAGAVNNGWARVYSVAVGYIQLDKTTSTMATDAGTAKTVRIFFGKVLKNETAESGLIHRRSFQLERDLGQKDTAIAGHQSEVLIGSIPNQFTLNVKQGDKLNADMSFVSCDVEDRTQADGLKSAAGGGVQAPALVSEDAFNDSNDISRLRLTILDRVTTNPTALIGFVKDFNIVVNNNVKPSKAVAVLGAFEATAGQFDVTGKITAYFSDIAAVVAVRNNNDVTFDFVFARSNVGFAWDIPLVALGDGRANVAQDAEIELPLDMNAAADRVFNHTLCLTVYSYLPNAAM